MPQTATVNRRIVLAARPNGLPVPADFRLEQEAVAEPAEGQVLTRTLYLSLDPYMRGLMSAEGPGYAPPTPLGAPMAGGTVSRVVVSRHPGFQPGDLVLGYAGWQDYGLSDGADLVPLGDMAQPSLALGGLGMPAFTAHYGLLDIGQPKPGETVVVGAATGAVGAVVGQIARLKGARVVGIAGGADKCRYAEQELGFDLCLDRHAPDLAARLALACRDGIDVYFESVGGEVFDAVLPLLNIGARVPVCGYIAGYNDQAPPAGPDRLPRLVATLLAKRIRMQGFIILDHYGERFDAFRRDMQGWLASGQVTVREQIVEGLENAPAAFTGMLQGGNFGKLVVKVANGD
ncbi:NADP-dependent oxidoreductase [Achromobacter xylosoxidans]|uniref:NADP-dependent oxidoreductase n=1 Tax=Alcaligenes xylosoxydans xylosoxydans TaxID=85698 RepID=UPI0006C6A56F|nr:NADP-dependent oxidoreductase [Achromobacter xylosoxidans]MCH4573480.1 NADP-dependent oxidoreductase [Achromobacter xylosoxidans]MDD7993416.1 NADP-dependent oxidoreductase [Achromobacter xylosoxidans]NEV04478.1 zinc-binding dehydrogenase [Achromobacter xylosoxidans]OFO68782.1 NADP-dependent oxidoreductase [Achromobacter xylosoxidans]OMG79915.1 NADP-dependent oxidoreductase [Achromobacter xylosoxidans]